jgi:hypothetical protein
LIALADAEEFADLVCRSAGDAPEYDHVLLLRGRQLVDRVRDTVERLAGEEARFGNRVLAGGLAQWPCQRARASRKGSGVDRGLVAVDSVRAETGTVPPSHPARVYTASTRMRWIQVLTDERPSKPEIARTTWSRISRYRFEATQALRPVVPRGRRHAIRLSTATAPTRWTLVDARWTPHPAQLAAPDKRNTR